MFTCEICGRETYDTHAAIEGVEICSNCFYEGQPEADQ